MKKLLIIIGFLASLTFAQAQSYFADLYGSEDFPPGNTNSFIGTIDFSLSGSTLSCTGGGISIYGNLPHIMMVNDNASGANGSVLFNLEFYAIASTPPFFAGVFAAPDSDSGILSSQEISDLDAGDLYVNIMAGDYANGVISGEIVPEPSTPALIGVTSLVLLAVIRRQRCGQLAAN